MDYRQPFRNAGAHLLVVALALTLFGCNQQKTTRAERQGAELYSRMCAVCHGPTGGGYKADQAPTLTHPDFLASVSDRFLDTAIANGRTATTMSAWGTARGGPLAQGDVRAIVSFLRLWDRQPHVALDERPLSGDATRGEALFARECARCHGEHGLGGPNVSIGNIQLLSNVTNGFLRHAIRDGRSRTAMPAFGGPLGQEGIDDVVALLRRWQGVSKPPDAAPARPPPIPLGPVPLNARGPEPAGFHAHPGTTPADVVKGELDRHARMALLDARAPSDYTNEHIAGAVSVPFYDPEPYLADLPRNAWLVCYCSCPHAESGQLAQKLAAKGFTKVTVLDEGLGVWKARKYATHTGTSP